MPGWLRLERKQRKCRECTLHFRENLAFAAHHLPASYRTAVAWQRLHGQMSPSSGSLGSGCSFEMSSKAGRGWLCLVLPARGIEGGKVPQFPKPGIALHHFDKFTALPGRIWEVEAESRTKGICLTAASLWVMDTAQILSGCFPCSFQHFSTQSPGAFPRIKPCTWISLFKGTAVSLFHCTFLTHCFIWRGRSSKWEDL